MCSETSFRLCIARRTKAGPAMMSTSRKHPATHLLTGTICCCRTCIVLQRGSRKGSVGEPLVRSATETRPKPSEDNLVEAMPLSHKTSVRYCADAELRPSSLNELSTSNSRLTKCTTWARVYMDFPQTPYILRLGTDKIGCAILCEGQIFRAALHRRQQRLDCSTAAGRPGLNNLHGVYLFPYCTIRGTFIPLHLPTFPRPEVFCCRHRHSRVSFTNYLISSSTYEHVGSIHQ